MILCPDCCLGEETGHILLEDFGLKDIETVSREMEPKVRAMYPNLDSGQMTLYQSPALWQTGERHFTLTTDEEVENAK